MLQLNIHKCFKKGNNNLLLNTDRSNVNHKASDYEEINKNIGKVAEKTGYVILPILIVLQKNKSDLSRDLLSIEKQKRLHMQDMKSL